MEVRGGPLGWFLCWAVVFADIGTSIYYVPGFLHGQFGARSVLFVLMTLIAFMLLAVKYGEVAWRTRRAAASSMFPRERCIRSPVCSAAASSSSTTT